MPGERLYAHTDFERLFGNNKIARNEQTYRQQAHTHTHTSPHAITRLLYICMHTQFLDTTRKRITTNAAKIIM